MNVPQRSPLRARLGTTAVAALICLAACGGPSSTPSELGAWRYGSAPADLTPVVVPGISTSSGTSGSGLPEPAAPAPAPAPATAPAPTAAVRPAPAAPEPAGSYTVAPVAQGGTIRAFCRLTEAAKVGKVSVFKDNEKGCGHEHDKQMDSERVVFDAKTLGLGNCVVRIRRIEQGKDWPAELRSEERKLTVDQKGCRYLPHVAVVREGTQLVIVNSDRADHNIHGYKSSMKDTQFNFSSEPGTTKGEVQQAFLEVPATYFLKCDIHPWMSAAVHVMTHPYFDVTSAQDAGDKKAGEAILTDVPPGEYQVECWHEGIAETPTIVDSRITAYTYSPDFQEVKTLKVAAGQVATVEFQVPPR